MIRRNTLLPSLPRRPIHYVGVFVLVAIALLSVPSIALADGQGEETAPLENRTEGISEDEVLELLDRLKASSDAQSEFASFSPEQQAAVIDAMENGTIEGEAPTYTTTHSTALRSNRPPGSRRKTCKTRSQVVHHKILNFYLNWEYISKTKWCYNGSVLTRDPFWTRDAIVEAPLWEFVGHTDKEESGGRGDWEYENYTEGHFRYCIGPGSVGCVVNKYPSITKSLFADGTYELNCSD